MFFFLFIQERKNKQANENTNIHYEYTHDKWYIVTHLKKQVEKQRFKKTTTTTEKKYEERGDDTYLLYFIVQIDFVVLNLCTCWYSKYFCSCYLNN
jgi:hypothetical protein